MGRVVSWGGPAFAYLRPVGALASAVLTRLRRSPFVQAAAVRLLPEAALAALGSAAMESSGVTVVALTGGIGSGKSTVEAMLAARGAVVVDSDVLAREVVAPGSDGLAAVVDAFGPAVLTEDGSLDRPAMAAIVFADDAARETLNAIIHPRVRRRTAELTASAPSGSVVVHSVPLLVETGRAGRYARIVVIDCPVETQVSRLVSLRGMAEADARARIAAQATREERLAVATSVIHNEGSREDLAREVDRVWREITEA